MTLLDTWAAYRPNSAPYVLPDDRRFLRSERAPIRSWRQACRAPDFEAPDDSRLHLGLLPQPFIGDLRRASIYVLLLNPGLGATDYFGEYEVPAFRQALVANLRQAREREPRPFLFLDPRFAWHGGFAWWHRKLAKVIEHLAQVWHVPFAEARSRLAGTMASIEMFPYHSASFRDAGAWLRSLPSVRLAQAYVATYVLRRVRSGKAIVIVTRKARHWKVARQPGVVICRHL